jgi:hypothetical protein
MKGWSLLLFPNSAGTIMRGWGLGLFPNSFAVPVHVSEFEADETRQSRHELLTAIERLKERDPRCLPFVLRSGSWASSVEMLHTVHLRDSYDAFFQDIDVAYSWLEIREHRARQRYMSGLDQEPDEGFMVTSLCIDNFPVVKAVSPKSVWEWLRNPAL